MRAENNGRAASSALRFLQLLPSRNVPNTVESFHHRTPASFTGPLPTEIGMLSALSGRTGDDGGLAFGYMSLSGTLPTQLGQVKQPEHDHHHTHAHHTHTQ